jgi:GMP synthase (glutamine-hydrolysing)
MRRILVLQHVAHEILGTLNPLLKIAGFRIRYVNFGRHPHARPSLDGYHGLVALGGPMNVDEVDRYPHLATEMTLIREALDRGMPVLGICLGAQLVARALGASVGPAARKEIGWHDLSVSDGGRSDPLLSGFGHTERIFQWHGDTFDIPRGAIHLASSDLCPNQAFRYGDNVYGFQFHLEVDEPLIERWLSVPVHRAEIEALSGAIDPEEIRRETRVRITRARELSDRTFGEWVRLFGPERRGRILASR